MPAISWQDYMPLTQQTQAYKEAQHSKDAPILLLSPPEIEFSLRNQLSILQTYNGRY